VRRLLEDNEMNIELIPSNLIEQITETADSTKVIYTDKGSLKELLQFLRDEPALDFKQLVDITAVDYPGKEKRFEVIYSLLSIRHNKRVMVKVRIMHNEQVESIVDLFSGAGWVEREAWDMYGVAFKGNPDLRRILTDYGFEGHPLRKDFPLSGHVEVRYDENKQKIVYEPVSLPQEFRNFDFLSPWSGPDYVLPGDEKATKS
jgi:NADH-quinone oxidoreductase subunit C